MVKYSSERLDHDPRRTCSDPRPRQLSLLRVSQQRVLSEIRERPLTFPISNSKRWIRLSLGNNRYPILLHSEECHADRRTERRESDQEEGSSEEGDEEDPGRIPEKRTSLRRTGSGAKVKASTCGLMSPQPGNRPESGSKGRIGIEQNTTVLHRHWIL